VCGAFLFMEEKILCHIIILGDGQRVTDGQIVNQIVSAYNWEKESGPVLCCCDLNGYEYLVRNRLDEALYIDVIVVSGDVSDDKKSEMIGEGVEIVYSTPFNGPQPEGIELDNLIDSLPERYATICRDAMAKELTLSSI